MEEHSKQRACKWKEQVVDQWASAPEWSVAVGEGRKGFGAKLQNHVDQVKAFEKPLKQKS